MERFDGLSVDELMSGIQVVVKDSVVSNGDENYILFSCVYLLGKGKLKSV